MIPAAIIAIGAGLAALGVGKSIKAGVDTSEANDVNARANRTINDAKNHLETCRKASNTALEALGGKKLAVMNDSVTRFVNAFERLHNVDFQNSVGLDEIGIDKQSFNELREMGGYAASILGGTAGGVAGGALAAFGAYSGAMAFGAASTGTAIATLSGAAATNATLAFLGGGSLAAGGLGMAGGAAVLGGLVAGPALAIMGFVVGAKASENLDKAYSNLAEARKAAEELNTAAVLCDGIKARSQLFVSLLNSLDTLFVPFIIGLEQLEASRGLDYRSYSSDEKKTVSAAASLAKAVKTVLDTPILTTEGKLTDESKEIAKTTQELIAEKIIDSQPTEEEVYLLQHEETYEQKVPMEKCCATCWWMSDTGNCKFFKEPTGDSCSSYVAA
jgi:hypothetical protein